MIVIASFHALIRRQGNSGKRDVLGVQLHGLYLDCLWAPSQVLETRIRGSSIVAAPATISMQTARNKRLYASIFGFNALRQSDVL